MLETCEYGLLFASCHAAVMILSDTVLESGNGLESDSNPYFCSFFSGLGLGLGPTVLGLSAACAS